MKVTLQATNLDLTDDLRAFVARKMQDSYRAFGDMNTEPIVVDIELEQTTRRYQRERPDEQVYRAEANVRVPGRLLRAEASAPEIQQAIVRMKNTLTRAIRTWREHLIDQNRQGARAATAMQADEAAPPDEHVSVEEIADEWEADEARRAEARYRETAPEAVEEDLRDFV